MATQFSFDGTTYELLDPSSDWMGYLEVIGEEPRRAFPPALMHITVQGQPFLVFVQRSPRGEPSTEQTLEAVGAWFAENEPESLVDAGPLWQEAEESVGSDADDMEITEAFDELAGDLTYTEAGYLDNWHSLFEVEPYTPLWNMAIAQALDATEPEWVGDTWYAHWLDLQREGDEDLAELENADDFVYAMGILIEAADVDRSPLTNEGTLDQLTLRESPDSDLPSWSMHDVSWISSAGDYERLVVFYDDSQEGLLVFQDYLLGLGLRPQFVFPTVEGYTVPHVMPDDQRIFSPVQKRKNRLLR